MAGPPPNMDLLWSLGQTGDRYPIERTITDGERSVKEKWEPTTQPAGKTATSQPAKETGPPAPAGPLPAAAPTQGPEQAPLQVGSVMPATPVSPEILAELPAFDATDPALTEGMNLGSSPGFDWSKLAQYGMPLAMMAMMGMMGGKGGGGGGRAMMWPMMMMLLSRGGGLFGGSGATGGGLPASVR